MDGMRCDIRGGNGDGIDGGMAEPSDGLTKGHATVTPDGLS